MIACLSPGWLAAVVNLGIEIVAFLGLLIGNRKYATAFFNAQDYASSMVKLDPQRTFPQATASTTFEQFLPHYLGLAKIIITLAAASISFGGLSSDNQWVYVAKLSLAYSIAFALLFCVFVVKYYEDYLHDLKSYTVVKLALVESLGFSALACFGVGYAFWASHIQTAATKSFGGR